MVFFNISAEDSTPLISYSPLGVWTDSPIDASSQLYSSSSWHVSSTEGSTASVTFNGTGIWFYGAKRPGYGTFTIDIDGQSSSGEASSLEATFQQLLGGASGLSVGSHTAVLTHTGSGPVDLDSIVLQAQIGSNGSSVTADTTDDTDSRLIYSPEADWGVNDLQDTAVHWTETGGAFMQYSFTGDAVSVLGTVAPNHANYTVAVDGQTQTYDGTAGHGVSALQQSGQRNTGKYFDVDFITVYSAVDSGGNNTQTASPTSNKVNPSDTSSNTATPLPPTSVGSSAVSNTSAPQAAAHTSGSLTTSVVVGIVVGTAAFLAVILAVVLLIYRRRGRRRDAKLPIQAPRASAMRPKSNMNTFTRFGALMIRNPFADPVGQPPLSSLRASSPTPSRSADPFNVPGLETASSEASFYSTDDYDVERGHTAREGPGRGSRFRVL